MKLRNGQWIAPFWGSSTRFIGGRDMLGMQRSSIATYATLLPGLTNVTTRMRYYGFFLWILEEYAKLIGKPDVHEFRKFIRRCELLLSFIMISKYRSESGVQGSNYTTRILKDNQNEINIADGADNDSPSIKYWDYSSGAFGQYYQGSLSILGLIAPIEANDKIMVCTPKWGRKLADLFDNNLSDAAKSLFIHSVQNGSINLNDLDLLSVDFDLNGIEPLSEEWHFYINLLFGPDNPLIAHAESRSYFRNETILLYLEYLRNPDLQKNVNNFHQSFYDKKWYNNPLASLKASVGWHYYSLNEFSHFSVETFFWVLLKELENNGMTALPTLLKKISNNSLKALEKDRLFPKLSEYSSFKEFARIVYRNGHHPNDFANKINTVDQNDIYKALAYALGMIAHIYIHESSDIEELSIYSRENGINRDGDAIELFNWIDKNCDMELNDFIEKMLLHNVINRHLEVAMIKMRDRNENTQKFLLDNFVLKPVGVTFPGWTGPRTERLHTFLADLKLIDLDDALTDLGLTVFNERLS